jgi:oligopeptide transport system substrate-binding protein
MMPFRHKSPLAVACGLALSLLAFGAAGCDNNPYPPGESAKNVLYRSMGDDPKSLDPTFSYTVDEAYICDLIYPSFYKYDYLKREPYVTRLNIGAKEPTKVPYPFQDKDGKSVTGEKYTFTLRPDLRFQDHPCFLTGDDLKRAKEAQESGGKPEKAGPGRAITAKDVIYAFKRMADPETQCPVASFVADKIIGFQEYSDAFAKDKAANYSKEIPGVQQDPNDPYTFHVLLNQPYPQLKYIMAMHFTAPQAREAVEFYGREEYARNPVGSGPYKMAEYRPKQRIVLEKNPNCHKAYYPTEGMPGDKEAGLLDDAGKELPLPEKVVFNFHKENVTAWNLFQQGYLDAAAVGRTNYQQAMTAGGELSEDMKRRGIVLNKSTGVNVYYLAFNMSDPVFGGYTEQKRKLRQAISLTINAQEFIDIILQGNGLAAEWLLPPSIYGYDEAYKNPYRTGTGDYDRNLEKAKKLLAEAGYPDGNDSKTGQKLVLHFDNTAIDPDGQQTVGILSKMIERIGVKVESRTTRPNVFQDKLLKGQHQFILYGWFADYPDPENFVFLLYGPNKKPGPNSADYASAEYDKVFEGMRSLEDGPERLKLIQKLRDISTEDCPWIPVYHTVSLALNHSWLKNVKAHPLANDFNQYRRVDADERAKKQREWNQPNYWPLVALAILIVGGSLPAANVVKNRVNRRVRKAGPEGGSVV